MRYFKKSEFECPCCKENGINLQLLTMLDNARHRAEVPFIINSGYRCKDWNKKKGGGLFSAHLTGYAADIRITSSQNRFKIVEALIKEGFTRILIYETFVHVDIDPEKPSPCMTWQEPQNNSQ